METVGYVIAGVLVVYSVIKTLLIIRSKKDGKVLGYDLRVLTEKNAKEFQNLITNLLSNLTFFFGTTLYLLNVYTDYGLYIGIAFVLLVAYFDYYFVKKLFPKEYKRIRG